MNKVTIKAVFRETPEGEFGKYNKIAIKVEGDKIGEINLEDRWISALGKKAIGTESWKNGDEVYINFIVTEKGYFNFELPDEKDKKIAELEAKMSNEKAESEAEEEVEKGDVDPDEIDF